MNVALIHLMGVARLANSTEPKDETSIQFGLARMERLLSEKPSIDRSLAVQLSAVLRDLGPKYLGAVERLEAIINESSARPLPASERAGAGEGAGHP